MADTNKDIVITPNKGSLNQPSIVFTGNANVAMTLRVVDDNSLSFENQTGQLFSIANNVTTGTIFSVNDISGIPSLEIDALGNIDLAEFGGNINLRSNTFVTGQTTYFSGNVGIGTTGTLAALQIAGNIRLNDTSTNSGIIFADGTFQNTAATSSMFVLKSGDTMTGNLAINANSASPALLVNQIGSGDALRVEDSTSPDATPVVIRTDGQMFLGYDQPVAVPSVTFTGAGNHNFHVHVAGSYSAALSNWQANGNGPSLSFSKSRGTTAGDMAAVANSDQLGGLAFSGSDGNTFIRGARIYGYITGTPNVGVMPTTLVFSASDADGVERTPLLLTGTAPGGQARIGLGNATVPSLTFQTDEDTGIYRSATNSFSVATGGVQRLNIVEYDSEIFARTLAVDGSKAGGTGTSAEVRIKPFNGNSGILSFWNSPGGVSQNRWWWYMADSVADLDDGSNAGANMYLRRWSDAGTSLGDVMIINRANGHIQFNTVGTTTLPTLKFGASSYGINWTGSSIDFVLNNTVRQNVWTGGSQFSVPIFMAHNNSAGGIIMAIAGGGTALDVSQTGTGKGILVTCAGASAGDPFTVEDSTRPDATPFIIKNDGKVGIGTTTPTANFEITGGNANITASTTTAALQVTQNSSGPAVKISQNSTGDAFVVEDVAGDDSTPFIIKNDGRVGIGTTAPGVLLDVVGGVTRVGGNIIATGNVFSNGELVSTTAGTAGGQVRMIGGNYGAMWRNDGSNFYLLFTNSGLQYGVWNSLRPFYANVTTGGVTMEHGLTVIGAITATGEITAYSSDRRLKSNVETINNAVTKLSAIRGVTFDWDNSTVPNFSPSYKHDVGVLAQDVEAVLPEAIRIAPFDRDENGNSRSGKNYLTVQYEKLTALLIEAVKEQQQIIEKHEQRINQLERLILNKA